MSELMLSALSKIFSRQHRNIFLIFPRKQNFTFHADCQIICMKWNVKPCFLGKKKENITNLSSAELAKRVVKVKLKCITCCTVRTGSLRFSPILLFAYMNELMSCWNSIYLSFATLRIQISWLLKKQTDLDLRFLSLNMWILNGLVQVIWLAEN